MGRKKKMGKREKKKMKKEIITDGGEDRISNLPESLIHHILSFLDMRDVIRTCLLSKRWRIIWKTAPVLVFGRMCHDEFIDQSLVHYEGQKVKKLQVRLDFGLDFDLVSCRMESWVRFAAMHGVEELHMSSINYDDEEETYHALPNCLFECLELRVLSLSLYACFSPQPFRFPLLTKLYFTDVVSNYFDTSACPLLEVLSLREINTYDSMEIHAPNPKLRYLDISERTYVDDKNSKLTLYAPNVLHIEFEGSFERFYEFKDISSVQTLSLFKSDPIENGMAESMVELLRNLTHVMSLNLSQYCILILADAETIGLEIPSLSATCLELGTNLSKCALVGITSLLKASRCIERLIINLEDPDLYDESLFEDRDIDAVEGWKSLEHALSVELPLNTILIRNFPGYCFEWNRDWFNEVMESNMENFLEYYDSEIKLVEVLLMSSKRLNKMNISIMNPPSEPFKFQLLYYLTKKLLVFPRASAKAEVYFT